MSQAAKGADFSAPASSDDSIPRGRPDELLGLARAACTGDSHAITTLVTALGGGMLKTVRKVLGSAHPDVEDITQDAVLALLSSLSSFRGDCSVTHFAHRIALLTALAARRRLRTRDRFTEADALPEALPDERVGTSPLHRAIAARRRNLVLQLLDELPDATAEALALHFILGHTVEEIAVTAAVPANTVWSRLRLGKQALRKKLERDARLRDLLRARD